MCVQHWYYTDYALHTFEIFHSDKMNTSFKRAYMHTYQQNLAHRIRSTKYKIPKLNTFRANCIENVMYTGWITFCFYFLFQLLSFVEYIYSSLPHRYFSNSVIVDCCRSYWVEWWFLSQQRIPYTFLFGFLCLLFVNSISVFYGSITSSNLKSMLVERAAQNIRIRKKDCKSYRVLFHYYPAVSNLCAVSAKSVF